LLLSLRDLWRDRIDSSRPTPVLELSSFADGSWNVHFKVIEGGKDLDAGGDIKLFDRMLCRIDTADEPPPEVLFEDLLYFNSVFPLAKAKWDSQPDTILRNIALAHPVSLDQSMATLQLYRSSKFKLTPGDKFRLVPRLVDFNISKILRNILEVDVSARSGPKPFLLRLLENPSEVGRTIIGEDTEREERRLNVLYRQLRDLGNTDANQLVFQPSQRRAMRSILKRQVTVVWGPPGSGKTHTLALSILYLLE